MIRAWASGTPAPPKSDCRDPPITAILWDVRSTAWKAGKILASVLFRYPVLPLLENWRTSRTGVIVSAVGRFHSDLNSGLYSPAASEIVRSTELNTLPSGVSTRNSTRSAGR